MRATNHRCLWSIGLGLLLLGCGPTATPPPAQPIDNQRPPSDPVTIPHQATLPQLRALIADGALAVVELPIVDISTGYNDVDGRVASEGGQLKVTTCWERGHTLLEDGDGRVHVVIGVDDELARRSPSGGSALLGLVVAPSCTTTSYELLDGLRAGWHIEVLGER